MAKYRKKPVVIEALRVPPKWVDDNEPPLGLGELAVWLSDRCTWRMCEDGGVDIETLEGVMHATPGDWIIRGVNGEFYPCKPGIFAATYDPA